MKFIRQYRKTGVGLKERLVIKGFKTSDDMHKFLNAGANSLQWQELENFPLLTNQQVPKLVEKAGTYAYAGGQWHNVKSLDPSILAHI